MAISFDSLNFDNWLLLKTALDNTGYDISPVLNYYTMTAENV